MYLCLEKQKQERPGRLVRPTTQQGSTNGHHSNQTTSSSKWTLNRLRKHQAAATPFGSSGLRVNRSQKQIGNGQRTYQVIISGASIGPILSSQRKHQPANEHINQQTNTFNQPTDTLTSNQRSHQSSDGDLNQTTDTSINPLI